MGNKDFRGFQKRREKDFRGVSFYPLFYDECRESSANQEKSHD